ncbi:MAG TPA: DUF5615 family PIN-like protein [Aggregatilineales bacterium]|nr:DUF5615 family PIN-like protein [Aggregatilineales bacterium]
MAQLYADEDFPRPVVEALRQLGHDVLTAFESNQANQSIADADVLAFATKQKRALLTFNRRHFIALHLANPQHAGLIVCRKDIQFSALAQRIDTAIRSVPQLENQLLRVNRPG